MQKLLILIGLFAILLISSVLSATYDVGLACRYCEYCLVSYCIGLGGHGVPKWTCPACKKYFPGVTNVTVFKTGFGDYDVHAFVAYEPTYNEIIIAFEGTEPLSITDWIDDLEYHKIVYPLSSNCSCEVHKGFWETYNAIRIPLWQQVQVYADAFKSNNPPIHITGHSLGSALATHCALDGYLNYNARYDYVYTFGPPRVGDQKFADFYIERIPNHFRVTHHKDPVPQLPEQWQQKGFHHISHEVFYPSNPNTTHKVCDGSGEDPTCRDQYGLDLLFVADHLDYMGFSFTDNEIMCKL